ncbi:MAG TPA: lysylphosphatidylglycerol synthase domain-containing protein [Gaiellaceae bacterium]|nr:lysylphosphatidylglycerol synthase domain-containing protein [Gaiellaceae bacterium]
MTGQRTWNPWPLHRLALLVIAAAVLAAGALVGLAWTVGFRKTLTALVHPHWIWLAVAVAGEVLAYLGYTAAYREVARSEGGTELEVPKAAALVAAGFGVFVHGGGFALDRTALRRAGLSEREARRRVLSLGTLEYAVLAPATLVAAVIVVIWHPTISTSLTLPWIIGVPAGAVLALTALRWQTRIAEWPLIGKPLVHGLQALALVLAIVRSPARHALALFGTLAYWAGDIFCLWATLHAFSAHTPPVAQLIVGYATGYALTRRALPLGGAGIVETLLPFSLEWLKISLLPALLAVFAYRLINLWLPMIPALAGLPTLRRLEARRRRKPGEGTKAKRTRRRRSGRRSAGKQHA